MMYGCNIRDELLILLKLFSKHAIDFIHAGEFYYLIDIFDYILKKNSDLC